MATVVRDEHTFGQDSPVLAYWLLHSEGFRVRGRRGTKIVAGVYVEPPGAVTELALRGRLFRRVRMLPADAIVAVVPGARLLVAGHRAHGRRTRTAATGLAHSLVVTTRVLAETVVALAHIAALVSILLARAARPHVVAFGRLAFELGRRGLAKARDGEAARRWIAISVGKAVTVGAALRIAISRWSSSAAVVASDARRSAAASARATGSSWRSWRSQRQASAQRSWPPRRHRA